MCEEVLGYTLTMLLVTAEPSYERVARIPSPLEPQPRLRPEAGWESVGGKGKCELQLAVRHVSLLIHASSRCTAAARPLTPSSAKSAAPSASAWASSNPFAALPGSGAEPVRAGGSGTGSSSTFTVVSSSKKPAAAAAAAANAEPTKRQRQNAAKAAAAKAAKADEEAQRLARLAQHKRQLEAERMKEQAKKSASAGGGTGSKKQPTSTASISPTGKLVWD